MSCNAHTNAVKASSSPCCMDCTSDVTRSLSSDPPLTDIDPSRPHSVWGLPKFFRFYLIPLWRDLWQLRFLISSPSRSACQGAFSFVTLQGEGKEHGDAD